MSTTQHATTTRTSTRRLSAPVRAAVAAGILALGATTLAAAPAQATTTKDGCTVTPLAPKDLGNGQVRYEIRLWCAADYTVKVQSQPWEKDGGGNPDDKIGGVAEFVEYRGTTDATTLWYDRAAPNTENGDEEAYHRVRFQVRPSWEFIYRDWTASEASPVTVLDQTPGR